MRIPFFSVVSALLLITVVGFTGTAAAQDGLYVEGKSPSGETVKVVIKSRPAFKYPRRAQRLGVEGFVVLAFDVNEQGELIDLRVTESKPRLVFDKAATQYIKKFKFEPPSLDGSAVYASDITMRMPFRLE
jgi:protein TonB